MWKMILTDETPQFPWDAMWNKYINFPNKLPNKLFNGIINIKPGKCTLQI